MAVPPAHVRVPSKRLLVPSVTPVTSVANDKDDYEMIPGTVHRSPGIYLTAEKNPGNHSYETVRLRGCATSHRLKWDPFLQMRLIGSHSTSGREKEGKKERNG